MNYLEVPPHSLEAEAAVIGGVLLKPEFRPDLSPEQFYRTGHQVIWGALLALEKEGKAIDFLTLHERLRAEGAIEKAGGTEYLTELTSAVPTLANISHYAEIVEEHHRRRRLITAGYRLSQSAHQKDSDCLELLAEFLKTVEARPKGKFQPIKEIMREVIKEASDAVEGKSVQGVSTGYPDLDHYFRPEPGEFVIVAGRPSMGKTAFALNLAANHAEQGQQGIVFTLEMVAKALGRRLVAQKSKVSGKAIRNGTVNETHFTKISSAVGKIAEYPLWIDSTKLISSEYVRQTVKNHKRMHGLNFIIIDHLKIMRERGKFDRRDLEVTQICVNLAALAKELEITIYLVHQLNRKCEDRNPPIPMMSDLAESGSIEENADTIIFLYRPEYYLKDNTPPDEQNVGYAIIAKQREGETGMVKLTWLGECTSFESYTKW